MPKGPQGHHSAYISHWFHLKPHNCVATCRCVTVGCTQHWQWKNGQPSHKAVDTELYLWGAFEGWVAGQTKQERFRADYGNAVRWVRELNGTTIFCDWDSRVVADVFQKMKAVFAGHTVPATKALYFFVPDLFIILDRKRVWSPWKTECAGWSILPRRIDDLTGNGYVALMEYVRDKIWFAVRGNLAFTLGSSPPISVNSIDQLRLVTPLSLGLSRVIGHTIGKTIDNIIC